MVAKLNNKGPKRGAAAAAPTQEAAIDFGFRPGESAHHFLVVQQPKLKEVLFFEQFDYDPNLDISALTYNVSNPAGSCKCLLSKVKWELIADAARTEFNRRGREHNTRNAQFRANGYTYLHRLLGKELLVLVWAMEEADPGNAPLIVQNWLGLRPEERWWLYTITNAATGHAINGKGKGWRKALRYALGENPTTTNRVDYNLYNERTPSLFTAAHEQDPDADLYTSATE